MADLSLFDLVENEEEENSSELAPQNGYIHEQEIIPKGMDSESFKNASLEIRNSFTDIDYPTSYKINSMQEKYILSLIDNFCKQYHALYQHRKPLFIKPLNEFDIEKFVCSTIRPMELPFTEMNDWKGTSEFVADHLIYVPLSPPYELPLQMFSPSTVLAFQKGHCFEYSTVLTSLLIGVGYDAYAVSGYATREICLIDQTLDECPLLQNVEKQSEQKVEEGKKKYSVKPARGLKSKYELFVEEKLLKAAMEAQEIKKATELDKIRRMELPAEDPLYALRTHSWVLVLAGQREVQQSFFIEPTTGLSRPLDYSNYLGIESIWNDKNMWVCMQDCSDGVKDLKFDLKDGSLWEFVLLKPDTMETNKGDMPEFDFDFEKKEEEQKESAEEEKRKCVDLPPSWVLPLVISDEAFKKRCPRGKKVTLYKKSKLEKFAPYLLKDGLVERLSIFRDYNRTDLIEVREKYENRVDKLNSRLYNYETGWTYEYFSPGRPNKLKEHHFKSMGDTAENQRTSIFYSSSRPDSLMKRVEDADSMTEYFEDRDDYLYYKLVEYGAREKKFGPSEVVPKKINKMVVRYGQVESKEALDDNVAEITFSLLDEKITVVYHREENRITATVREFMKPNKTDDKGKVIMWNPSTSYSVYMSNPLKKDKKKVSLYKMMMQLMKLEDKYDEMTRESEMEVQVMLEERIQEELNIALEISVFDAVRSDKAKKRRAMLERIALEEKLAKEEKELDLFATFLSKEDVKLLNAEQIEKVKEDMLEDIKQRFIDRANLIQNRYDKETSELQKKQLWFQQNQMTISKEDEHEYITYIKEAAFRIQILEMRLKRHKEQAPLKYAALKEKLENDPRLKKL